MSLRLSRAGRFVCGTALCTLSLQCTHVETIRPTPWLTLVERRPTHVVPHMLILGDESTTLFTELLGHPAELAKTTDDLRALVIFPLGPAHALLVEDVQMRAEDPVSSFRLSVLERGVGHANLVAMLPLRTAIVPNRKRNGWFVVGQDEHGLHFRVKEYLLTAPHEFVRSYETEAAPITGPYGTPCSYSHLQAVHDDGPVMTGATQCGYRVLTPGTAVAVEEASVDWPDHFGQALDVFWR